MRLGVFLVLPPKSRSIVITMAGGGPNDFRRMDEFQVASPLGYVARLDVPWSTP